MTINQNPVYIEIILQSKKEDKKIDYFICDDYVLDLVQLIFAKWTRAQGSNPKRLLHQTW